MKTNFQKGGVGIIVVISLLIAASFLAGVYFYLDRSLTKLSTVSEVPGEIETGDLTGEQPSEDFCQNECSKFGERECIDKESYHICSSDAQNCLKWSPALSCLEGGECENGDCVKVSSEQKPEELSKVVQCNAGPCCNFATQQFHPDSYVCHGDAKIEYGCPWGNQDGSDVGVKYQHRYCSSSSADCNGELKWSSWSLHKMCSTNEKCENGGCVAIKCTDGTFYGQCSGTKPKYCENGNLIDKCSLCNCPLGQECQSDGSCVGAPIVQCASGLCCDTSIETFRPSTYKCQGNIATEYGCPWGEQAGSDVGARDQDRYCSGSSKDCEGELKWTNWYIYQECLTDEACSSGECVTLELCQNECSSTGLRKCSNNSYQICGNHDEDSCLEWGLLVSCPSNTICQDGSCVHQNCADGTLHGQCSTNKPKYCDNGSLISECSLCGCPSGQECQGDGSCKITEEDNFCGEYYGGVVFDGFCFTDFDKTVFDDPRAENGILKYTPDGSNVERVIGYPASIKVVDFGVNFDLDITLENKGQSSETIRFNNFEIFIYNVEELNIDEQYTVQAGETKNIEIAISLPEINARPNVSRFIRFDDNSESYSIERIIFYWDYNPFSEEFLNVEECGGREYVKNQGVCYDDTLFPSIEGLSCQSDNDCLGYGEGMEEFRCYEYTCLDMSDYYIIGSRNKEYEVGILPLYVTDDDNQYNAMRNAVNNQLDEIIPEMENWFSNEKLFWGVYDLFNFDYFKINDSCRMTHAQFQEIHPVQGHMPESELREIEDQCIDNKNYDILIISIQRDDYWDPTFTGAGINYETIIASALNHRTIIHETLHSFGEHDIYGVESYQWGNCYLYNANTGGDWNEGMPHLCKFEAMQLDWLPKLP